MDDQVEYLQTALEEERNVNDIPSDEEVESIVRYEITSYGIDFALDGLVKRIKKGSIFIPPFQRGFVWKLTESSRLIESLLLGLPVPGIFLAQEPETGKMLVIDGQQRLLSLFYFFEGFFNFQDKDQNRRVFRLTKVQPQYEGKTFETLEPKDRINLEDCVIHATVVKQDSPASDDTSIYHIFERLNSGGRKLIPQEIRSAVYHGPLIEKVRELNLDDNWRKIYGKVNERMKDQELIIRFFAMLEGYQNYKQPMKEFINLFTKKHRSLRGNVIDDYSSLFKECCKLFVESNESRPFRIGTALNVAFFEAAMVGLAFRIKNADMPSKQAVESAYRTLASDEKFIKAISQATANPTSVENRIEASKAAFAEI